MPIGYWLIAAVLLMAALRRTLRRVIAGRLRGRSLVWRVRARHDLRLTTRGLRLRLFGIAELDNGSDRPAAVQALQAMIGERPARLRVLAVDDDGTLAVVLRCAGRNPAEILLRHGLVRSRGTGTRRYRQAQAAAQVQRCGLWRLAGSDPIRGRPASLLVLVFPWWQG